MSNPLTMCWKITMCFALQGATKKNTGEVRAPTRQLYPFTKGAFRRKCRRDGTDRLSSVSGKAVTRSLVRKSAENPALVIVDSRCARSMRSC